LLIILESIYLYEKSYQTKNEALQIRSYTYFISFPYFCRYQKTIVKSIFYVIGCYKYKCAETSSFSL